MQSDGQALDQKALNQNMSQTLPATNYARDSNVGSVPSGTSHAEPSLDRHGFHRAYQTPPHNAARSVSRSDASMSSNVSFATPSSANYTHQPAALSSPSYSSSPTRASMRSVSSPPSHSQAAAKPAKSSPALASFVRPQQGAIKALVNRFNQTAAPSSVPVEEQEFQAKHRKISGPVLAGADTSLHADRSAEPTKLRKISGARGGATSFTSDTSNEGRQYGREQNSASQREPTAQLGPADIPRQPLFGEVVIERPGAVDAGYGIPSARQRSGSESSAFRTSPKLSHQRSQSNLECSLPIFPSVSGHGFSQQPIFLSRHQRRSQSDYAAMTRATVTTLIPLPNENLSQWRQPTGSRSPAKRHPHSRIPLGLKKSSSEGPITHSSQTGSAMNSTRNGAPMSPRVTREREPSVFGEKEAPKKPQPSLTVLSASRYDPVAAVMSTNNQSLRAFIGAPVPQKSPPLRSSRPRQPVSFATTPASRAKVAERFAAATSRDTYSRDQRFAKDYRSIPPKIPGNVDFAERRARIARAISQNFRDEDDAGSAEKSGTRKASKASQESPESPVSEVQYIEPVRDESVPLPDLVDSSQNPSVDLHVVNEEPKLRLDVKALPRISAEEPSSGRTESEIDESPVLGLQTGIPSFRLSASQKPSEVTKELPDDWSTPADTVGGAAEDVYTSSNQPGTLLSHVMRMRERSTSSASRTDFADDTASSHDDRGSINIMLDDDATITQRTEIWVESDRPVQHEVLHGDDTSDAEGQRADLDGFLATPGTQGSASDEELDSPAIATESNVPSPLLDQSPRMEDRNSGPDFVSRVGRQTGESQSYSTITRILDEYHERGTMSPELLHEFQRYIVTASPSMYQNGSGDDATIRILLDKLLQEQPSPVRGTGEASGEQLMPTTFDRAEFNAQSKSETAPMATPTAYHDTALTSEELAEQHVEEEPYQMPTTPKSNREGFPALQAVTSPHVQAKTHTVSTLDDGLRPPPPPKDWGYSPRSSTGQHSSFSNSSSTSPPTLSSNKSLPEIRSASETMGPALLPGLPPNLLSPLPPLPDYSPPPPPTSATGQLHEILPDSYFPSVEDTYTVSPVSFTMPNGPVAVKPSLDVQRPDIPTLPASRSEPSMIQPIPRQSSLDDAYSSERKTPSPTPEQRRLTKRLNTIKELLDTEHSYHHDMKIIEEIYKGTVGDLITLEDKKVIFGNSDQVCAFADDFSAALRRAASAIYKMPMSIRWGTKRGSISTSHSGGTDQSGRSGYEILDDERDRRTSIGNTFGQFLSRMEKVYGDYLKNQDASNQRLQKLQHEERVKAWLGTCHENASDITSAWDLNSLLVKPFQRILKYSMMLDSLLETTPADHPDHRAIDVACQELKNVSQRINDAKKRQDLVDQIVNRKRKESDVRSGLSKAFGRRAEKMKERVGMADSCQDPQFDELHHRFGGHFIRLQVCMRDVERYVRECQDSVDHFNSFVVALEAFIDVGQSTSPEIESKWRRFALAIRELTAVTLPEHKAAVHKSVIDPIVNAIQLHDKPQKLILKRKKRILDHARYKAIIEKGDRADKRTQEQSELYLALNETLKEDLPRLYSLSAELILTCHKSFIELQKQWNYDWERKLRPVLEEGLMPESTAEIIPAFTSDFDIIQTQLMSLGICNGAMLAESANFLSPSTTLTGDETPLLRRPATLNNDKRTWSLGSDQSPSLPTPDFAKRYSGNFSFPSLLADAPALQNGLAIAGRWRSNSALSGRTTPTAASAAAVSAARSLAFNAPNASFSRSRSSTANAHPPNPPQLPPRMSTDSSRSPRPPTASTSSSAAQDPSQTRFSGAFSSAMPMVDSLGNTRPASPKQAPEDMTVLYVAASLYEFNIDRERKEGGFPYLTYAQGEIFDIVAERGEIWLAKNQDDPSCTLGWIWEQHFVKLQRD
ncbi:hypothetical protein LTR50_006499 [Elasticomyces elasticus]|nr:hypothetical protein LTR50_006499 [Elasticomyces elasticus]